MAVQPRPFTGQTQALGQTPRPARPWYAAPDVPVPPPSEIGAEPESRPPVDGYVAWYDLSKRGTITGNVDRVDDLSGNAHHLGPAPGGNPSVGRQLHDLHALDCNASADEALTCADNLALSTSTIFIVVRVDEVNSGRTFFSDDGASAPGHTIQIAAGPVFRMDAGTALDSGITVEAGAAYVLAAQFAGDSTSRLYVNGEEGTIGDAGSDTLNAFNVMAFADDSNCVDGALGEVIIYSGVLSDADREAVETYLLDKWTVGFPHIQTQAHGQTASGTSHSVTMPDGIESGDILTVHASVRPTGGGGPGTVSFPGDWTEFTNSTTDEYHVGAWKVADGSEGASITVTSDAASEAIWWANRIVDHNNAELEYDEFGGPATPDSPSLTPSWGEAKNLWLASTGLQSGSAFFDTPTDYVGFQQRGHDAVRSAFAFRKYQAATDDPSSWGGGFDNQQSFTVAIRGAPPPPEVTNADAGVATGTGTANNPQASIAPSGGEASGSGAANTPAASIAGSGGLASGSGDAGAPGATISPTAGEAAGTGAAFDATVQTGISVDAGHAAGTGSAQDAAAAVAGTGGEASGSGAASPPGAGIFPTGGQAAGTGTAETASAGVGPTSGAASGSGAAEQAGALISGGAGEATGSGAASPPSSGIAPTAGEAAGTGTAFDATVQVSGGATVFPSAATGTGTANDVQAALAPAGGTGSASGAAGGPGALVAPTAGVGTGSGTAEQAGAAIAGDGGHASGSGAASPPGSGIAPTAAAAAGVGQAFNASVVTTGVPSFPGMAEGTLGLDGADGELVLAGASSGARGDSALGQHRRGGAGGGHHGGGASGGVG